MWDSGRIRPEWDSPEKDKDAERRRGLADSFSQRVRIKHESFLKTGQGLEPRRHWIHNGVFHGDPVTGEFKRFRWA